MYTSFHIGNFRCFRDLTVEPLARVNLICGRNNAGKTALLEALWFHTNSLRPRQALRTEVARRLPQLAPAALFSDIFLNHQTQLTINLTAEGTWGRTGRSLNITADRSGQHTVSQLPLPYGEVEEDEFLDDLENDYTLRFEYSDVPEDGPLVSKVSAYRDEVGRVRWRGNSPPRPRTAMVMSEFELASTRSTRSSLASRLGRAELEGYLPRFVEMLQTLEPRLQDLTTIVTDDGYPHVYARLNNDFRLPVAAMGDGTGRLLSIALRFPYAKDGVVLIDEIENGLHHTVLVDVWKTLDWLSKEFKVQIFATTHSYECISAATTAFTGLKSKDLHLHRLSQSGDRIRAVTYNKDALDTNLDYLWELR